MQDVKLLPAGETDIPVISDLATRVWNQHYPAIISQAQISYMLSRMYNEQSLRQQMLEQGHRFFLVNLQQKNIGFVSVHRETGHTYFINKFYIDQELAAKGIGTRALEQLKEITQAKTFRLTVNRGNYKAINFYFKNGFTIESVTDIDIGNGYQMNDFVMRWKRVD